MRRSMLRIIQIFVFSLLLPYATVTLSEAWQLAGKSYHEFTLQGAGSDRTVAFRVPKTFRPEISDTFFRIYVDYPSMGPVQIPERFAARTSVMEIVVTPIPANGNVVADLLAGRYGAKLVGNKDGYDLYEEPIGKTSRKLSYVFRSVSGEDVAVADPGSWSVRYRMVFLEDGKYVVRCHFGKELGVDFREIHAVIRKFMAGLAIKEN